MGNQQFSYIILLSKMINNNTTIIENEQNIYIVSLSKMITNDTTILKNRYINMLSSKYNFYTVNPAVFIYNANQILINKSIIKKNYNIITYNDFHTSNMGSFLKDNKIIWGLNDFDSLSYNNINIDFMRFGASYSILNNYYTKSNDIYELYKSFIIEYIVELEDINNKNKLANLYITLDKNITDEFTFLNKIKNNILSNNNFINKYIKNNKFIISDEIININKEIYNNIEKLLIGKYNNIKIYDIIQKLNSGDSTYGSIRYYVFAKYNNDKIIIEIKQIIPIYDKNKQLIVLDGKTIYDYTKIINGYSWSNIYNYLKIDNLNYIIRLKDYASIKIIETEFNKFDQKYYKQYAQISGKLLARFHYNSLVNKKININDYIKYLNEDKENIINNIIDISISYVDINKKLYEYYKKTLL